ncbi:DNA-invertase hin [Klebsiella pneumoniae]|uniref:DNA-invertase hin n=1 Tax=Klebsiella pneumoniae TaxID=573 RepID=A0A378H4H7_KLEPN|nr:DNA-invertase hin [Klebsiella pneumoniae]
MDRPNYNVFYSNCAKMIRLLYGNWIAFPRSLKDLLLTLEKIENTGADFRSITENIDTSTPAGRMMMQIVGSFAEFETRHAS